MATPAPVQLLTLQQAADRLQINRSSVYHLINRGELAVTDVATDRGPKGRTQSRISEQSLAEFIARRTRSAQRLRLAPRQAVTSWQ